jgi:type II secretory pathway pseudopilin PulG
MQNKMKRLNQNGITLIEVLTSIILLFIILTSFFTFFNNSLIFSGKNEEELVAFNLASKTLKIVEEKYKNTLDQNVISLNCSNYPGTYPPELISVLEPSACYYKVNDRNYYPEISITKQVSSSYTGLPILYVIHIKISNSPVSTNQKLLSETFGYIRGK